MRNGSTERAGEEIALGRNVWWNHHWMVMVECALGCLCEIKPPAHSPGQPTSADPAWGWVGHGDLQSPFQPQPFCDFVSPLMNFVLSNLCNSSLPSYLMAVPPFPTLSYPFHELEKEKDLPAHMSCAETCPKHLLPWQSCKSDGTLHLAPIFGLGGRLCGEMRDWGLEYFFYFASWG